MPDGRTTVDSTVVTGEGAVSATAQELIIQTEQIGWNQFRFRPASRLGVGTFEYEWSFGDGQTSNERVIEHSFAKPGRYSVSLRLVDPDGGQQTASMMVRVGFFHLANWRLWVIIGLLALIIILGATTAGVSESLVPQSPEPLRREPSQGVSTDTADEIDIEPLSSEEGNLESLASTGQESGDLSDGLALLESLGSAEKDQPSKPAKSKPIAIASQLESDADVEAMKLEPSAAQEEPVVETKPKAKKKTTKKRPSKKRTIKVKNVS